ncbi:MAG: deoxynucleoside kinase [Bacteroidota bacterium]|nr:deoxynucleoside kinase [Bacteroidota bacterium]
MIIALEGIDGVGKTTMCNLLKTGLGRKFNIPISVIPDPDSNDPIGHFVRQLLNNEVNITSDSWALIFAAASINSQSGDLGYIKSKTRKELIILDRCVLSSYAYFYQKCTFDWLDAIHKSYQFPDITIVIEASESEITKRLQLRINETPLTRKKITHLKKAYKAAVKHLVKTRGANIIFLTIEESFTKQDTLKLILNIIQNNLKF